MLRSAPAIGLVGVLLLLLTGGVASARTSVGPQLSGQRAEQIAAHAKAKSPRRTTQSSIRTSNSPTRRSRSLRRTNRSLPRASKSSPRTNKEQIAVARKQIGAAKEQTAEAGQQIKKQRPDYAESRIMPHDGAESLESRVRCSA
jgi:hypothetical protein